MIAREGLGLILVTVAVSLVFFGLAFLLHARLGLLLASLFALVTLFLLFFFRDPARIIPSGPNLIVSPSDGTVLGIESLDRNDFLESVGVRISVFLSPLDVHVIRSPVDGKVEYSHYEKGEFKAAYKNEASLQNENLELGLITAQGRIVLRQIAGFLARRIVCQAKTDDQLTRGARLGIIKFGSRVELILPPNVEVKVAKKDKIKAGETVIGVFQ